MHKKIIITLLLLGWLHCASAQKVLHFYSGVSQGHLNFKFLIDAYAEKRYSHALFGASAGLGLTYLDKGLFSMRSDLFWHQGGGMDGGTDLFSNVFNAPKRLRTSYVSASTLFCVNPINKAIRLQIGFGPRIDYMAGSQNRAPLKWYKDLDLEGVAKFNFGGNAMLGLSRRSGSLEYGLSATYIYRARPLVDIDPSIRGQFQFGGARGTEQSLLYCLSLGRIF